MQIGELTELPRPTRLRVIAAAAYRYIGQARNREDAAAATENLQIVLLRMAIGRAARHHLPVPKEGGLRSKISRTQDRFFILLHEEIAKAKNAPADTRNKVFTEMSDIKRESLAPQGLSKLCARLVEMPQFSGVAALLTAGIELIIARETVRTNTQRLADKMERQFRNVIKRLTK